MQLWVTVALLGLLVTGSWAQGQIIKTSSISADCDSPEAEAAALVAQDYLNAQHTHGYKYALNRIESNKLVTRPGQENTFVLELDFLETTCHVLDPTPVNLCPVRQKHITAVEADCDFAVTTKSMSVVAFKCKTETEIDDDCLGCPSLLPLNDTAGLQLIETSLNNFNKNNTLNTKFALFEIGRMASQVVSGAAKYFAEYAIIGTNCTVDDDDFCIPQNHTVAIHGFCLAESSASLNDVNCKIFSPTQIVDPASNATVRVQQLLHAHTFGPQHNPTIHGLRHHKVTALHDPAASGLISAESLESAEVVVQPKETPVVKREVAASEGPAADSTIVAEKVLTPAEPILSVLSCPGKKKHF